MTAGSSPQMSRLSPSDEQVEQPQVSRAMAVDIKMAVVAGQDIPHNTLTAPLRSNTPLVNLDTVFWNLNDVNFIIEVELDKTGKLVCKSESSFHSNWIGLVRLARHCHMQNVQIIFDDNQTMHLHVIKNIRKGEPLYSWFSMDTAKIFHIPFLTPKNILDSCRYSCHQCGKTYEDPNPLKIHLTFQCPGRLQLKSEIETPTFKTDQNSAFHRVFPQNKSPPHRAPICAQLPLPNYILPIDFDFRRVVLPQPEVNEILKEKVESPATSSGAAETESADGDGRRRHKCIYCGKLYSRKYGLKIHVRTHTGYKPLKCKVCLRPFGDPSNLNKHVRLHAEGLTPYKCQICGKVLVRRRDLERHLRSRHPSPDS